MTVRAAVRVGSAVAVWLVLVAVLVAVGSQPAVVVLAALVAVVAVAAWSWADLTGVVAHEGWGWRAPDVSHLADGSDRQVWLTERRLRASRTALDPALYDELVALADERLRANHGIDRALQPERAAERCGPELWAFLQQPPRTAVRLTAVVTAVVAAIEAL